MLDHLGFRVADLGKARRFYDAVVKPLGLATIDNSPTSFLRGAYSLLVDWHRAAGLLAPGS